MKKTILYGVMVSMLTLYSCKKDKKGNPEPEPETPVVPVNNDNYSSLADFYSKNKVAKQTYTINATNGGSFITPQATTVSISPNSFFPLTGNLTVEFKDIYKKSDMLLSNMPTQMINGAPLKSAGEFFIKVLNNNVAVAASPTMGINVKQPFIQAADTGMKAFIAGPDSSGNMGWYNDPNYTVLANATNYVFSLYSFNSPIDSGTWCNSDNPSFFGSVPQTTLTAHANQTGFNPDVFLVFKNVNAMIHVYQDYPYSLNNFSYKYIPAGTECTVVAIGVKDGKLHSSFTSVIMTNSPQTINFNLTETTTANFKTALQALD